MRICDACKNEAREVKFLPQIQVGKSKATDQRELCPSCHSQLMRRFNHLESECIAQKQAAVEELFKVGRLELVGKELFEMAMK